MIGQNNKIKVKRPNFAGYQNDFLYCKKRFTVVEASTKSGKTFSHLFWIFEIAHGENPTWFNNAIKPGMEFWWVAPIFPQAEIAFNRLVRKLRPTGRYTINSSKLFVITPLGSIIRFKSADKPDGLYGEDVYAVIFDEFTRAKEDAWFALRSTLTFTKGICKFIGNYTGSTNWGHKLSKKAKDPNGEYAYFKVDAMQAVDAGILSKSEVEQARKDLPKSIFEALYLAKGSAEGDILFPSNKLDDLFTNDFVKPIGERYITADIATYGSDRFVIGVWFGMVLKKVYVIDKCEHSEVEQFLKEKAKEWGVPRSNIVYDADGIGSFLESYLKDARPFKNGSKPLDERRKQKINYANLKTQCFYNLSASVNKNLLYVADQTYREDIERELELIRRDKPDDDGKLRITPKAEIKKLLGFSPDFADMIMMREYFNLLAVGNYNPFAHAQQHA